MKPLPRPTICLLPPLAVVTVLLAGTPQLACHDPPAHEAQRPGVESNAADIPDIRMVPAFPKISFERPVWMTQPPGDAKRVFVLEQAGRVLVFPRDLGALQPKVFLDIRKKVRSYRRHHNEEGLLALAFHPEYATNGYFYVHYTASNPMRGLIARYCVSKDDPDRADEASEKVLLEVPKPFGNHDGCCLLFGPDGYLYATFGDGGAAGDPFGNGQKLSTLLAKIIRIDVDHQDAGQAYAIPKDNPFAGRKGVRGEIWAYGLRNVWRMSFDPQTGDLWAGDVGQDEWEEVDLIQRGGNYGWNIREGRHAFKRGRAENLIEPVAEYDHAAGLSVTGGYVYRGERFKSLQGVYLYADYAIGTIWGLRYAQGRLQGPRVVLHQPKNIASFAEDVERELYVLCFDGRIYRIEAVP